ncbi:hypothetical protein HF086_010814 [Spodoptera exigua]|uniref:C2H2-type domain-containing protein n=1 Tax=Spodoptera exigua TaxID=7107 RepID=A0A922M9F2_SPOEX|nr:hypothetical protein HF086_010814 [Spodoptera exigua]
MEIINILIDQQITKSTCFLCFKHCDTTIGLHETIEIQDEYLTSNLTLGNMMKKLFPTHDSLLSQSCEECFNLIIKIFMLLQRQYFKAEIINRLVDNMNEELDNKENDRETKKYKLKINMPTFESISEEPKKELSTVQCSKCDMKFNSKVLLQKHFRITHKNTNKANICDICGKVFNRSSALKAHLNCHKLKQCPYCSKILKSHSHYKLHLKNHSAQTKRKRQMKYYTCGSCDYKSLNKNTLEAHINKTHLNTRPYVCDICQKGFYKKSHLTQHFLTHEKVKDKTCEICGDAFVNEKTLVEHLMIHSGQKPFKCDVCGAEFITSGRRLEHMKRKHLEKSECCIVCDKKFGLKKDLNAHLKHVHG